MNQHPTAFKVHTTRKRRAKARKGRGSRSGRYSTAAVYRAAVPQSGDEVDREETTVAGPPVVKHHPGMATDYHCRLAPGTIARIQLTEKGEGHHWIDWVYVPPTHRATGLGRRMMAAVLADADANGVRLSLEARACAGLSQEVLERWYVGQGFAKTPFRGDFGPILVRTPAPAAAARRAA